MQPLQAKLRWDIDVRPLHRETSTIRFVPTSERRRAIVTCSATMCATIGVTGYPRSASCPRRRAVALPHSRRRRAAAGSVPPPLLDGRKSVAPTTCANLHASTGVTGYPRSANCPAPSRHCSQLDDTSAPVRIAISRVDPTATRWPTVHLHRATQSGRETQVRQTACAPSHYSSLKLSQTVRGSRHTPAAVSPWSKIDRIDLPRHFRNS